MDHGLYANTRKPVWEASTLPPMVYADKAFFKHEQQMLFRKAWTCVGFEDKVRRAGDTITADVAGEPIFVVRDKKGELRGFKNVCRHRGHKLVLQDGRYPVISCPYHRWGYALDGRLLATPLVDVKRKDKRKDQRRKKLLQREASLLAQEAAAAKLAADAADLGVTGNNNDDQHQNHNNNNNNNNAELDEAMSSCDQAVSIADVFSTDHVKEFNKKDFSLFQVRVGVFGGLVFVNVSGDAPPLEEYLGDLPAVLENVPLSDLEIAREKRYEVQANWKLLAENFMEYYHLPSVHPELTQISGVDDHKRLQGPGSYVGFVTHPLTQGGTPIDVDQLPPFDGLKEENGGRPGETETAYFHHIFPNVFWFLLPHHNFVVITNPTSPRTSMEHAALLVDKKVGDAARAEKEAAIEQAQAMIERQQQQQQQQQQQEEEADEEHNDDTTTVAAATADNDLNAAAGGSDCNDHSAVPPAAPINDKLDAMFDFYDLTNLQDIRACEMVQDGVRVSDYEGGRMAFKFEETIHRFQNMVADYTVGFPRIPPGDEAGVGVQRSLPHAEGDGVVGSVAAGAAGHNKTVANNDLAPPQCLHQ
eukprot:g1919.t1